VANRRCSSKKYIRNQVIEFILFVVTSENNGIVLPESKKTLFSESWTSTEISATINDLSF
jgi:hypothetical protein